MSGDPGEREALIAWSAIAEGADPAADWLIEELGAEGALEWLRHVAGDPVGATVTLASRADRKLIDRLVATSARWVARLPDAAPEAHLARADAVGARAVTRADPEWPVQVDDLGAERPFALWVRGPGRLDHLLARSVAIVGSRASTGYGQHMAAELAGGASDAGWCVVSGGAYGIDAAAHRAALTGPTPTVAVMAGGVDRLYPAGNGDLLGQVVETGAVFAEVPPGFAPHRSRFLARNRLIGAAVATCIVEAAARSGALSTANHAIALGRPLGAVPGPATAVSSVGCHALIRDGKAVLVSSTRELLELAGPIRPDPAHDSGEGFADPLQRRAYDAIAARGSSISQIAKVAGLTVPEAMAALTGLEMAGLARSRYGMWQRQHAPQGRHSEKGKTGTK